MLIIERVESLGLETSGARGDLYLLDDVADASHDRWLADVTPGRVQRYLAYTAFGVDGPLNHEIPLEARVREERVIVASTRLVSMTDDDCTDVRGASSGVMLVRSFL
jgi:hypothetical protein